MATRERLEMPEDIKTAYVELIDAAAQRWKDGQIEYGEFRAQLLNHTRNIYGAGYCSYRVDRVHGDAP